MGDDTHPIAGCLAADGREGGRLDQPPQAALAYLRETASPPSSATTSSADIGSGTLLPRGAVPPAPTNNWAPVAVAPAIRLTRSYSLSE